MQSGTTGSRRAGPLRRGTRNVALMFATEMFVLVRD